MISTTSQDIVRTIFADDDDATVACADVREQIERVVAMMNEPSGATVYRMLYQHIMACGHCAAAYNDLQWVLEQAAAQTLVEPDYYPLLDLSFLPDPMARLHERVGQIVSRGHFWMRQAQGAVWLSLGQYLQTRPLHPAWKSPLANEHLVHLTCEPDENLGIELVADAEPDEHLTITVHVRQPDRFYQGYSETEVSLHFGNEYRTGQTNDAGRVVFTRVPAPALPELIVQVMPFDCIR